MTYLNSEMFRQDSMNQAVERLEHYFQLSIEAEDSNKVEETLIFHYQCRRWSMIASLIVAGVKATKYVDN